MEIKKAWQINIEMASRYHYNKADWNTIKNEKFVSVESLKNKILELDFEGAISSRELLEELGYSPEELNEVS